MIKRTANFFLPGNSYQQLLFFFFCLLTLPLKLIEQPSPGLGGSWRISINLALKEKLSWGDEYVFTFGPLGYLYTRISAFVPQWHIIVFSCFVWLCILFITRYFILQSKLQRKTELLAGIIIACMFSYVIRIEITTTVMYIVLFYLFYSIKYNSKFSLLIAILASVLNLFIKLNYFIPILVIFGLYYLMIIARRNSAILRKFIPIAVLMQAGFIYLLTEIYRVNIPGYIQSGWHLANAYNDAMFKPVYEETIVRELFYFIDPAISNSAISAIVVGFAVLLTIPVIYLIVKNAKRIVTDSFSLFTFLITGIFLFISFKFAFVRHGGLAYLYPPLPIFIIGMLLVFPGWEIKNARRVLYYMILIAFIPSFIINVSVVRSGNFNYSFVVDKLKQVYRNNDTAVTKADKLRTESIEQQQLPYAVKQRIGSSTIDVLPTAISIAYFNKLNYSPRPVVQGYAAYDKHLDDLNYNRYMSAAAPEYLIYRSETIDGRYHFFDEPATKLAVMQRYEIVDSFNNNLLFKLTEHTKQVVVVSKQTVSIELNKLYTIPQAEQLQFAKFDVEYTPAGAMQRFIFQPPILTIVFVLEDGRSIQHRIIITALKNPLLLSYYIESDTDLLTFFSSYQLSGKKIKQFMISAPDYAYKKTIKFELENIILK
jgi:hypothetical protein